MRRRLALFSIIVGACRSGAATSTDAGAPPIDAGVSAEAGVAPPPAAIDAAPPDAGEPLPLAVGDPCRGEALPESEHFVPAGMCARRVGFVSQVRQLTFAPDGDLFATDLSGYVHLLRDEDGDGVFSASEIHRWAESGGNGNNAHLDVTSEGQGYLYAGSPEGVVRFRWERGALVGGPREPVVVDQPIGGHGQHTVHVFDHWLYVASGSEQNVSGPTAADGYDDQRSLVRRFDLSAVRDRPMTTAFDWPTGEIVSRGLRNANGFARQEATKRIFAVVNGIDGASWRGVDVHEENPSDPVVELAVGRRYGFPFCFPAFRIPDAGAIPPGASLSNALFPGGHDDAWCAANADPPAALLDAHSAPLDLVFFERQPRGGLPDRFRGGAFVALHGSFNRTQPTGYKVVWQPFGADGTAPPPVVTAEKTTPSYEVVFGGGTKDGPIDGKWTWTQSDGGTEALRPSGLAIGPIDGALYIASDWTGTITRLGSKR